MNKSFLTHNACVLSFYSWMIYYLFRTSKQKRYVFALTDEYKYKEFALKYNVNKSVFGGIPE